MVTFLIGLALAIPLSILANLATPRVQKWLNDRPRVSVQKKFATLQAELDELIMINAHKDRYIFKSLESILLLLISITIFGLTSILLITPLVYGIYLKLTGGGDLINSNISAGIYFVAVVCVFLAALIVAIFTRNATKMLSILSKIEDHDTYIINIEKRMEELGGEPFRQMKQLGIRVEAAMYGVRDHLINIPVSSLKGTLKDQHLEILVNNDLGGDPASGEVKTLTVTYTYGGQKLTKSASEGQTLVLP